MGCLCVLPGSAVVPLPAKSRSCLYSSKCLRRPPHHAHNTRAAPPLSLTTLLFKLCLFKLTASTRPDLVRVRVRFGLLFAPLGLPIPSAATPQSRHNSLRHRLCQLSFDVQLVCLFVCLSEPYRSIRSTYTVQGPLCPNREPC